MSRTVHSVLTREHAGLDFDGGDDDGRPHEPAWCLSGEMMMANLSNLSNLPIHCFTILDQLSSGDVCISPGTSILNYY